MNPLYIAIHEQGIEPKPLDLQDLQKIICERDEVENPTVVCANDSAEMAEILADTDYNDASNWKNLVFVMIPSNGVIVSYLPCRLAETFKRRAESGKKSYTLFAEILGLTSPEP